MRGVRTRYFSHSGRANVLRLGEQLARHELRAWAVFATQETRHGRGVGILVGFPERGT